MNIRLNSSILFFILFSVFNTAHATVYFSWGAEDHPCDGSELPTPPIWTQAVSERGHVVCGPSPEGDRHMEFTTTNNQASHYTEINRTKSGELLSRSATPGQTLYLAYYFNFTRINGLDIWHETGQSADKGMEIIGNGIRWILARGHWSECNNGGFANNQDHRYTVWVGNPTYHLNPELEAYGTNQNGYSCSNPIQLEYERWYSAVMAVKLASDNTGSVTVYIDGVKVIDYQNIQTTANNTPTIQRIEFGGTIAQPAYDAPAHQRKFDAVLLTDDWQDIINGGYLQQVPVPKAPVAY